MSYPDSTPAVAAPITGPAFDLAAAKARLGITDALKDTLIQIALDASLAVAESYCDRKFIWAKESAAFYDVYARRLQVKRYPITSVLHVKSTNGTDYASDRYRIHKQHGYLLFNHYMLEREADVEYEGGYKVLPPDLLIALWGIFDVVWPSINGGTGAVSTVAPGTISSISIPDVGTVSFAAGGQAAAAKLTGSASFSQYGAYFHLLDAYRDISC